MYKKILVPVLFDEGHDTQASYAAAQALADKDATFTVLHVMETVPNYVMLEIPSEVMEKTREEAQNQLVKSAKGLPNAQPVLIAGSSGRAIVDYANDNNYDCIVIASHKMGFADIFLGSTAAKVVRHAKCSVHVIR